LRPFLEQNSGGSNWSYDVPSAALTFGKAVRFEAHLLGSFAEGNRSWLWAWANRHLNLPAENRALADAVRQLADSPDLQVFAADEPVECGALLPEELAIEAAHFFGVVVTGVLGYDAYYTIPYEGGRGVAVIRDERLRRTEPHPLLRISTIFLRAISSYPILDHRSAFLAYVASYGLQVQEAGAEVQVLTAGARALTARFDELNRLTCLEGMISPGG
jgi:hypothetical protein